MTLPIEDRLRSDAEARARSDIDWGSAATTSDMIEAADIIAALYGALEPFGKALDDWGDEPEQSDQRNLYEHPAAIGIGLGDLRRAAAALALARGEQP